MLDYTELASFHGDPDAFYDGAHVTAVNARRILAQAVKDAPQAFLAPAAAWARSSLHGHEPVCERIGLDCAAAR